MLSEYVTLRMQKTTLDAAKRLKDRWSSHFDTETSVSRSIRLSILYTYLSLIAGLDPEQAERLAIEIEKDEDVHDIGEYGVFIAIKSRMPDRSVLERVLEVMRTKNLTM